MSSEAPRSAPRSGDTAPGSRPAAYERAPAHLFVPLSQHQIIYTSNNLSNNVHNPIDEYIYFWHRWQRLLLFRIQGLHFALAAAEHLRIAQLLRALVELGPQLVILLRQELRLLCEAHRALDDGLELRDPLFVGEKQRRHHLHVGGPGWQGQVVVGVGSRRWTCLLVSVGNERLLDHQHFMKI